MNQKPHFSLKHALTCLCLLPFTLLSLTAQTTAVPNTMNYQGTLLDAAGDPLASGNYTLTFRLWSADADGTLLWGPQVFDGETGSEGHAPQVAVVDGQFNVILGPEDTGTENTENPDVIRNLADAFDGSTCYLEVTIGSNTPIAPRQQILSAPYAITAGSLSDGVSNIVTAVNGKLGIGGNIYADGADLRLGLEDGRDIGLKSEQRALVHYDNDELHINFDGDFEGGVVVDSDLEVNGVIVQEDWINVTNTEFQNGWVNYDGGFSTAAYFKDSMGIVHIKGLVRSGAIGTGIAIFTLPEGYRPSATSIFSAFSAQNGPRLAAIYIAPDGTVNAEHGGNHWLSLEGITFRAE